MSKTLRNQLPGLFHLRFRGGQDRLGLLFLIDDGEGEYGAVNSVVRGAIGDDVHFKPVSAVGLHLGLLGGQVFQDRFQVGDHIRIGEVGGHMLQGPADVGLDEVDDGRGLGGEAFDPQGVVHENRGDLRTVEQIAHVVMGRGQLLYLALEFGVDRLQFFVERLQLFLLWVTA